MKMLLPLVILQLFLAPALMVNSSWIHWMMIAIITNKREMHNCCFRVLTVSRFLPSFNQCIVCNLRRSQSQVCVFVIRSGSQAWQVLVSVSPPSPHLTFITEEDNYFSLGGHMWNPDCCWCHTKCFSACHIENIQCSSSAFVMSQMSPNCILWRKLNDARVLENTACEAAKTVVDT